VWKKYTLDIPVLHQTSINEHQSNIQLYRPEKQQQWNTELTPVITFCSRFLAKKSRQRDPLTIKPKAIKLHSNMNRENMLSPEQAMEAD
jgi:hypothetical protein